MPCYVRMKTIYLRGLLWLYLLGFGYTAMSLEPGFLDFDNLPDTNFSCVGKVIGGYYADLETNCQMFHVCTIGQLDEPMDIRFLCLNGTVFDQETRVCERIDEVDCSKSEKFYSLNLELYGNTQPSIAEETAVETEPPIVIKLTTTTTTTTTTAKPRTTRPQIFITSAQPVTTVTHPKVISTHHFPISNQPDIRFNPAEINISLNPGAPPNIRHKPISFQEQIYNEDTSSHVNNKKAIITTHTDEQEIISTRKPSTQRPKSILSYGLNQDKDPVTPVDINYGFTYHQTENSGLQYHTEIPQRNQHNYQYHHQNYRPQFRHNQNIFRTSTYRNEHLASTRRTYNSHSGPTTFRSPYLSSLRPPPNYHRTEKPQRLQLPLPLLPTLPSLTFSSPAPFTLSRHIETKRYTNEHHTPPRIIISASASVSDASGRRLNYSLGTIGVTPLLEEPPKSYDDYKDHDVVLDPFYHDVPKINKSNRNRDKRKRKKREAQAVKPSEVIKNEQEAVDVLKFLFDWYKSQEKPDKMSDDIPIPASTEIVAAINQELSPSAQMLDNNTTEEFNSEKEETTEDFRDSELFKMRSKFNIVGDVLSVTEKEEEIETKSPESEKIFNNQDYVDDNYEPVIYKETDSNLTEELVLKEEEKIDSSTNVEDSISITETPIDTTPSTTSTTTTATTTTRAKNRRRGRGRYFHDRLTTEKLPEAVLISAPVEERSQSPLVESINKEIAAIFTDSETTSSKPKIRRRGRGRSTYISSTTEETIVNKEEEIIPMYSSTVKLDEKVSENIATTVPNIVDETTISENTEIVDDKEINYHAQLETSSEDETFVAETEAFTEQQTNYESRTDNQETYLPETEAFTEELTGEQRTHYESPTENTSVQEPEIFTEQKNNYESYTETIQVDNAQETLGPEPDIFSEGLKDVETTTLIPATISFFRTTVTPTSEEPKSVRSRGRGRSRFHLQEIEEEIKVEDAKESLNKVGHVITTSSTTKESITDASSQKTNEFEHTTELLNETSATEIDNYIKEVETTAEVITEQSVEEELKSSKPIDVKSEEIVTPQPTTTTATVMLDEQSTEIITPKTTRRKNRGRYHAVHRTTSTANVENEIIDTTQTSVVNISTTTPTTIRESELSTHQSNIVNEHSTSSSTTSINAYHEVLIPSTSTKDSNIDLKVTTLKTLVETKIGVTETPSEVSSNSEIYHLVTSETTKVKDDFVSTTVTPDNLTEAEVTTVISPTTENHPTSTNKRRNRPRRPSSDNRRHRFSTELFTSRPNRRKPVVEEEIITILTGLTTDKLGTTVKIYSTPKEVDEGSATDAPLFKSVNPTQAESAKENLHTTPLSMTTSKQHNVRKHFMFNCFGKTINKFYSDPRDCRLFHYCTSGYTKNQLLDMKFVCDLGTYFEEEKLICTKVKPERCL